MSISKEQLSELKHSLQELLSQLEKDLIESKEASKPVELDQQAFGRVSRIDAITQQQIQVAATKRMEQRLLMIQSALKRMESEEFGYCLSCEEEISLKRLKAKPESTLCIDCAEKI